MTLIPGLAGFDLQISGEDGVFEPRSVDHSQFAIVGESIHLTVTGEKPFCLLTEKGSWLAKDQPSNLLSVDFTLTIPDAETDITLIELVGSDGNVAARVVWEDLTEGQGTGSIILLAKEYAPGAFRDILLLPSVEPGDNFRVTLDLDVMMGLHVVALGQDGQRYDDWFEMNRSSYRSEQFRYRVGPQISHFEESIAAVTISELRLYHGEHSPLSVPRVHLP